MKVLFWYIILYKILVYYFAISIGAQDKVIKNLQIELNETREKVEYVNKYYKEKYKELKKLLGLEIDIDKVANKLPKKGMFSNILKFSYLYILSY